MNKDLRIRGYLIITGFSMVILIYITRLFFIQVVNQEYAQRASVTDIDEIELIPSRGIIYDRNERMYVKNTPIYDIRYIPAELKIQDTSMITRYLGLTGGQIVAMKKQAKKNAWYQWNDFRKQVDNATFNRFSEHLWEVKGLSVIARPTRDYNYHTGALFLGYINEVSQKFLDRQKEDSLDYYKPGDLTGITGVEQFYEDSLRGKKGKKTILVDNYRREIGPYHGGALDERPIAGADLMIGVDAELQMFAESLMVNKRGSIVAIEPATGEILTFVSAPSYDPTLLSGNQIGVNYLALQHDSLLPLFNRPLQAKYPPGSIFKMVQALAALGEGVIDSTQHFSCGGAWHRNGGKPKCHGAHGSCSLHSAIVHSCNAYFAELYFTFLNHKKFPDTKAAYDRWKEVMNLYGLGTKVGIDLPNESTGNIPTSAFYDQLHKGSWGAITIYSNSIGQGEIQMTPLQMANVAATIANRGYYIKPHFAKAFRDSSGNWVPTQFERVQLPGKYEHFDLVARGMMDVVKSGTGTMARIDSINVAGKTGTVQNPPYEDHSVFICFAPVENPKIAVAVIVENAGWGGSWAAPIASLVIEKYLKGSIKDKYKQDRILKESFLPGRAKTSSGGAD